MNQNNQPAPTRAASAPSDDGAHINLGSINKHLAPINLDAAGLRRASEARGDGRLDRTAALVAEHHEQRRAQMQAGVLQRPQDRRPEHVASDADDEQLAETGVENEFGRYPAVAATENRDVRLLPLGQFGQHLLLYRRKTCLPAHKAQIALLEPGQRRISSPEKFISVVGSRHGQAFRIQKRVAAGCQRAGA